MEEFARKNPWLGLESYQEGEILYGRDNDIRDLSQCVLNDTDTLLYGKSGIGKSSILNAGILPAARRNGYLPVLIRLSHKEKHSYLSQINQAIIGAIRNSRENNLRIDDELTNNECDIIDEDSLIKEFVICNNPGNESLYEYFHRHTFHNINGERIKLLIIFDQFEEIFTLQDDAQKKKTFFSHLADLLNDIMPDELQQKVEMPSDAQEEIIVGEDNDYDNIFNDLNLGVENNLPEYVTDNDIHFVFTIREDFLSEFEYYSAAIPSLKQNRYGLRPINEEQAAQIILRPVPELIDESVAKLIIEKITGKKDFKIDGLPEIEVDSAVLSLYLNRLYEAKEGKTITRELVEQKGGEIISDFYNDALSDISDSTIEYLEDMLLNGQGRRDNITIYDAIYDGNVSEQELDILCNKKKILRQFNYAGDLRIEYVHDILCPVVKNHKEERTLLKLQEEERLRQDEEKKQLLREEEQKRIEIERKAEEEMARLEAEAARIKRRNRNRLSWALGFLGLTVAFFVVWWFLCQKPYSEYYGSFTTKNGWPKGLGAQLSVYDKEAFSNCYMLTRRGYLGRRGQDLFEAVHFVNASGGHAENNFYAFPVVHIMEDLSAVDQRAREFVTLLRNVQHLEYSDEGEDVEGGFVRRMSALSSDNRELFSVQYYNGPAVTDSTTLQWAVFLDAEGRPLRVRDNGVDRVLLQVKDGYITGQLFYSETGSPLSNYTPSIYGYRYEVDSRTGSINSSEGVDQFGEPVGEPIFYEYDRLGRCVKANDVKYEYSLYQLIAHKGEMRDTLRFTKEGKRAYLSSAGLMTQLQGCDFVRFWIDEFGNANKTEAYDSGRLVRSFEVVKSPSDSIVIEWDCDKELPFEKHVWSFDDNHTICAHYGGYIKDSINIPIRSGKYHKEVSIESKEDGYRTFTISYYDDARGPASINERNVYEGDRLISYVQYDSTWTMMTSKKLYYDSYGAVSGESVIGIDGDPIRCSSLEEYGMSYYKMRLVKNFLQKNVVIQGENEFGEECLITLADKPYVSRSNVQDNVISEIQAPDSEFSTLGVMTLYRHTVEAIQHPISVCYIHNLTKEGCIYKSDIKDGDLLIAIDDWNYSVGDAPLPLDKWNNINDGRVHNLTVLRPYPEKDGYEKLEFTVKGSICGSEIYKVYFTEKEVERLNKYIERVAVW